MSFEEVGAAHVARDGAPSLYRKGRVGQPEGSLRADVMTREANSVALTDLSGSWIDPIRNRRPVRFSSPVRRGGTQQEISCGASTCGALPSAEGQIAPANEAGLM